MHDQVERQKRSPSECHSKVVFIGFDWSVVCASLETQDAIDIEIDVRVFKRANTDMLRYVVPKVVVVNLDEIDCYGPRFVSGIRRELDGTPNLSIIAIGGPPLAGFHDQLRTAGATEICRVHDLPRIITKTCKEVSSKEILAVQLWENCLA